MSDKKLLDKVNPERREFLEKLTKGAFVVPAVISVMMLNQKLNLTTANAESNLVPCLTPGGSWRPGVPPLKHTSSAASFSMTGASYSYRACTRRRTEGRSTTSPPATSSTAQASKPSKGSHTRAATRSTSSRTATRAITGRTVSSSAAPSRRKPAFTRLRRRSAGRKRTPKAFKTPGS